MAENTSRRYAELVLDLGKTDRSLVSVTTAKVKGLCLWLSSEIKQSKDINGDNPKDGEIG